MASDDTLGPDQSDDDWREGTGDGIERLEDTYGEIRVTLRPTESVTEAYEERARELRVSRYDRAAARCGRWGDEQWR